MTGLEHGPPDAPDAWGITDGEATTGAGPGAAKTSSGVHLVRQAESGSESD